MSLQLPPPVDATPARAGMADRLAAMIQVPTISAEADARGSAFDDFIALLADLYPQLHSSGWSTPGRASHLTMPTRWS